MKYITFILKRHSGWNNNVIWWWKGRGEWEILGKVKAIQNFRLQIFKFLHNKTSKTATILIFLIFTPNSIQRIYGYILFHIPFLHHNQPSPMSIPHCTFLTHTQTRREVTRARRNRHPLTRLMNLPRAITHPAREHSHPRRGIPIVFWEQSYIYRERWRDRGPNNNQFSRTGGELRLIPRDSRWDRV